MQEKMKILPKTLKVFGKKFGYLKKKYYLCREFQE